jgi:hypothetical protein
VFPEGISGRAFCVDEFAQECFIITEDQRLIKVSLKKLNDVQNIADLGEKLTGSPILSFEYILEI